MPESRTTLRTQPGVPVSTLLCILAMQFFVAAACIFIPAIGTEDDELLFVPPAWWPGAALSSLSIFGHRIPTMLMSYVGADKTLLYWPILHHLPPSMWLLRLPPVFIGALTLWILFLALRRLAGEWTALALVWLLATDAIFLLTTTFDWGPVAIQHLFVALAFWLYARPKPMVFLGSAALGLAFWDKGTAIWTIGAFAVSAAVFLRREILARVSRANLLKAAAGAALGALPILIFNLQHRLATFRENAGFTTEGLSQKLQIMWLTLTGTGMFGFMVRGGAPSWHSLAPWLILLALPLAVLPKVRPVRPLALFSLLSALIIWAGMLFVHAGGTSVHHTILVWPWPYVFAICIIGCVLNGSRPGSVVFALLVAAVVVSNLGLLAVYADKAWENGPSPTWSDANLMLPKEYPGRKHILVLDWGIYNVAVYRSRGQAPIDDRTFSGLQPGDIQDIADTEFLDHVNSQEIIAGNNAKFDAAIEKLGLVRVVDSTIPDSHGNPFLVLFHCAPVH
ncbi:MAG TPA: hypothetical protein VEF06_05560 [Bryobacteraceae bacterium]|nr:hypothetical protein [Bryobacteraceae bacterium]